MSVLILELLCITIVPYAMAKWAICLIINYLNIY